MVRAKLDLTAQTRGRSPFSRKIKHVVFFGTDRIEPLEKILIDDHMTGGTCHRTTARPFDVDVMRPRHIKDSQPRSGCHRSSVAARHDEGDGNLRQ